jgi:hypothetical protein
MPKQKPTLVQYYAEGWRTGYLIKRGYKWTRIRRILPKGSAMRKCVRVATSDTREVQP